MKSAMKFASKHTWKMCMRSVVQNSNGLNVMSSPGENDGNYTKASWLFGLFWIQTVIIPNNFWINLNYTRVGRAVIEFQLKVKLFNKKKFFFLLYPKNTVWFELNGALEMLMFKHLFFIAVKCVDKITANWMIIEWLNIFNDWWFLVKRNLIVSVIYCRYSVLSLCFSIKTFTFWSIIAEVMEN